MRPDRLTVLYTACLRGRLEALPYLYTLLKRERARIHGPSITLDLGQSCTSDVWLCQATAGRALLVAMDSMGYDACYIDRADPLASDPLTFGKLREVILTPLVTDANPLTLTKHAPNGANWILRLVGSESADQETMNTPADDTLTIQLRRAVPTAPSTYYDSDRHMVYLTDQWDALQVGRLELALTEGRIAVHTYFALTPDLPPDPTISSVVEFVAAEARYASRRGKI
ncbi:MAG: hypothetical protein ACYDBJ_02680 [Aggregatilineales bacterium]